MKRISQAFKDFYFTTIVECDAKVLSGLDPGFQTSPKKKLEDSRQWTCRQGNWSFTSGTNPEHYLPTQPLMYFTTVM
jgi:hypothetical protein